MRNLSLAVADRRNSTSSSPALSPLVGRGDVLGPKWNSYYLTGR